MLRARFHEALLSIYLYNEHRGYTQLEALASALQRARPEEAALARAVDAHACDERRHYRMFRAWFLRRRIMPLRVGAAAGYIDRLVLGVAGCPLDAIDLGAAVRDDRELERLLRLIVLTERRGLAQVRWLLRTPGVLAGRELRAIFEVVERDEPAHFEPYAAWLRARGARPSCWRERGRDLATHLAIVALELPQLIANPRVARMHAFPA